MKAMILAAGRGERMRPLTDHTPKPLLPVAGKAIIEHTINALVKSGFHEIVINHAHLGEQFAEKLGNGEQYEAKIQYSDEGNHALETAGGIMKALPLLGDEPFLVVNGDVATDFAFCSLHEVSVDYAHLVLVNNPPHHAEGDFGLNDRLVSEQAFPAYTFSGIGIYHPKLFDGINPGKIRLGPLLRQQMALDHITGQYYNGFWMDIGTVERLQELETHYHNRGTI